MFKFLFVALLPFLASAEAPHRKTAVDPPAPHEKKIKLRLPKIETAVFAGGCFWSMEIPFDKLKDKGVISATVGYSGGVKENPTYEQVSEGNTGHREAVQVVFDSSLLKYSELLELYWKDTDPFDDKGQFCDKGDEYRPAIFYANDAQKRAAEESRKKHSQELKKEIVTAILPAKPFYKAETYHQDYYKKNPTHYFSYRAACGRDARTREIWGAEPAKAQGNGSSK